MFHKIVAVLVATLTIGGCYCLFALLSPNSYFFEEKLYRGDSLRSQDVSVGGTDDVELAELPRISRLPVNRLEWSESEAAGRASLAGFVQSVAVTTVTGMGANPSHGPLSNMWPSGYSPGDLLPWGATHNELSSVHLKSTDTHLGFSMTHYNQSDNHAAATYTHLQNTDTHTPESVYHSEDTTVHDEVSETHTVPSNTHRTPSTTHSIESTTHAQSTWIHKSSSRTHSTTTTSHDPPSSSHRSSTLTHDSGSDTHLSPSLVHLPPSASHYPPSDTHTLPSNGHLPPSNTHQNPSNTHHLGSTSHAPPSNSHYSITDTHSSESVFHSALSSSTLDPFGDCDGSPNAGIVTFGDSSRLKWIDRHTHEVPSPNHVVTIKSTIATYDTPRPRTLLGNLYFEVVDGDASCIEISRTVGTAHIPVDLTGAVPILVSIDGHWGCGVHNHHSYEEDFTVSLVKPGLVAIKVSLDPLPEAIEGDGVSLSHSILRVHIPEFDNHWIVLKSFINCEVVPTLAGVWIPGLSEYFKGDNRLFDLNAGLDYFPTMKARTALDSVLTMNPPNDPNMETRSGIGQTLGYDSSQIEQTGNPPACAYELEDPLDQPESYYQGTQVPEITSTTTLSPISASWQETFELHSDVGNPGVPLSGVIGPVFVDWEVTLWECMGHLWVDHGGEVSDFPAHEIYLAGDELYTWTPGNLSNPLSIIFTHAVPHTGWVQKY